MLINYFFVAIRNFKKNIRQSIILMLGLSIGFAASTVLIMIVYTERSYDKHWNESNQIYQIESIKKTPNGTRSSYAMSPKLKGILEKNYSEVTHVARQEVIETRISKIKDNGENDDSIQEYASEVDNDFLKIFDYEIINGSLEKFYSDENTAVISSETSLKLFGKDNPIGQLISIDISRFTTKTNKNLDGARATKEYKVVAVFQRSNSRTSLPEQNVYIHFNNINELDATTFEMERVSTFVKLKKNTNPASILLTLPKFLDESEQTVEGSAYTPSQSNSFVFMKLVDIHLYGIYSNNSNQRLWILYGLAGIILLMACVNYVNLVLASYSKRQKEVALRKTMGASRFDIAFQFLSESFLLIGISFLLSMVIVMLSLPWIIALFHLNIENDVFHNINLMMYLFVIACFVAILAGAYPSFYLSRLSPADTLKSNKSVETISDAYFKNALIIVQFFISVVMLIGALMIAAQIHLMHTYNRGYQTENIVFASHESLFSADEGLANSLKNAISKIRGVYFVSYSMSTELDGNFVKVSLAGRAPDEIGAVALVTLGSQDELKIYDIPLLAGRYPETPVDIKPNSDNESQKPIQQILINEQAMKRFGFNDAREAINQSVEIELAPQSKRELVIVGVTREVHIGKLNQVDKPCIFWAPSGLVLRMNLGIRYNAQDRDRISKEVKALWVEYMGFSPNLAFIEDILSKEYASEKLIGKIIYTFTIISIFISCLGLYGLASYTTANRNKEIALRKINGASVIDIVKLLVWKFSKLVILANLIGWPIAIYTTSSWLIRFVNRVDIWIWGPIYCLGVGMLTIFIAWITIAGQAIVAARAKPINALRE